MKKIILTLGIFFTGILCLQAQEAVGGQDKQTEKWVNKLTEVCQLTPDQVTKVTPFVKQFMSTKASNKQKYASDQTGLMAANKENRDYLESQLKPILSADQQTKANEYIESRKSQNSTTGNAAETGSTMKQ